MEKILFFSINGAGTTGHPHEKKKKDWPQALYPSQNLTQNRCKTQNYKTPRR